MTYGHSSEVLAALSDWLKDAWAEVHADAADHPDERAEHEASS